MLDIHNLPLGNSASSSITLCCSLLSLLQELYTFCWTPGSHRRKSILVPALVGIVSVCHGWLDVVGMDLLKSWNHVCEPVLNDFVCPNFVGLFSNMFILMGWRDHCPEASWGSNCWKDCGSSSGARSTEGLQGLGVLIEAVSRVQDLRTGFLVSTCFNTFHWSWVLPTHQVVEVPVMGDTVPGNQQRTAVDLPILRREAPPEVRTEVVQGPPMPPEYVKGLVTAAPSSMANTPQRTGSVAMGSFAPPMGCWIARGVERLSKLFEVVLTSSYLHPIKSYLGFTTLYVSFLLGSCFTSRMTGGKEIVWLADWRVKLDKKLPAVAPSIHILLRFWMFDAWVSLASEWHTHWQSLFETGLTHDDFRTNSLAMSCIPNLTWPEPHKRLDYLFNSN